MRYRLFFLLLCIFLVLAAYNLFWETHRVIWLTLTLTN